MEVRHGEGVANRLQLLRELIPNLICVAVLAATPATDGGYGGIFVADLQAAATKAGLRLAPTLVDGPNDFERAFAMMSNSEAQAANFRQVGSQGAKILNGAKTANLPVEQAVKFELVVTLGPPRRSASTFQRRSWCAPTR